MTDEGLKGIPPSLNKMNQLADSLRASMPENDDDVKPLRTPSPQPPRRVTNTTSGKSQQRRLRDRHTENALPADMAQLASDYEEVKHRYEEVLKENESLKADMKRRMESYLRREKKYKEDIDDLRHELERQAKGRPEDEGNMSKLRRQHQQILHGIGALQDKTAQVLQEQEKDLLRAFRARLYDVQMELEKERTKKDDGALEWIEKTRTLGKELDWSREEALRLDRVNQYLSKENQRLKNQFKSQEDDREFLVRQLMAIKKENARLKQALEHQAASPAPGPRDPLGSIGVGKGAFGPMSFPDNAQPGAQGGAAVSTGDSIAANERIKELETKYSEMEARYRDMTGRLKRLLEVERRNLRAVRTAHAKDLQNRTELEQLLRQCVEDVKHELMTQRGNDNASRSGLGSGLGAPQQGKTKEVALSEFTAEDRERVMELLLSQERVINLLYEKTFPPRTAPCVIAASKSGEGEEADDIDSLDGLDEVLNEDL